MKKKKEIEEIETLEIDDEPKKSKFADVKEFLSDKKNKAIVKLIVYGLFILFVAIYVRVISSNNHNLTPSNPDTPEVNVNTITEKLRYLNQERNYSFVLNYNINDTDNFIVSGNYEAGILKIIIDDKTYYYSDDVFYEFIDDVKYEVNDNFLETIKFYLPKHIYKYLLKSNYQYKKEDLNENVTINSLLKTSDFANINNNITENDSNIVIETIENDSNKLIITLDMTNYYMLYDDTINKYIVNIEFNY